MKRICTNVKPRSTARIPALSDHQRQLLETWLFKENITYRDAVKRAQDQFGVKLDVHALMRFYRQIRHQRNVDHIVKSTELADEIVKAAGKNPGVTERAFQALVGKIAFHIAVSHSKKQDVNPKRKTPLNMQPLAEALELLVTTRQDDRQDRKFSLEREQWEFDVVRVVQEHYTALEKIIRDESMDEDARTLAIRRSLFGDAVRDTTPPLGGK